MLKSAGLPVNQKMLIHGFITKGGKKLSKSTGNLIDPIELQERYGSDPVKYFIALNGGIEGDFDYTDERFHAVYTELGNSYGNLVNRIILIALK